MNLRLAAAPGAVLLLCACAHAPADEPSDPLEPVNRAMYGLNTTLDKYVARPVARGYQKLVPAPARKGVTNFFNNLFYPTVIVNDALQGKLLQCTQDTGRLLMNTTLGLAGIFDPASKVGLPLNDEDFGQTLGAWGFGEGIYLMLPFFGPSDGRDVLGRVADNYSDPLTYVDEAAVRYGATGLEIINHREQLLGADRMLNQQLDPYVFIRTAYLEQRQSKVYDGNPPPEDYGFDEEDPDPAAPAGPPPSGPKAR